MDCQAPTHRLRSHGRPIPTEDYKELGKTQVWLFSPWIVHRNGATLHPPILLVLSDPRHYQSKAIDCLPDHFKIRSHSAREISNGEFFEAGRCLLPQLYQVHPPIQKNRQKDLDPLQIGQIAIWC